jgi:hypothetical protein
MPLKKAPLLTSPAVNLDQTFRAAQEIKSAAAVVLRLIFTRAVMRWRNSKTPVRLRGVVPRRQKVAAAGRIR